MQRMCLKALGDGLGRYGACKTPVTSGQKEEYWLDLTVYWPDLGSSIRCGLGLISEQQRSELVWGVSWAHHPSPL